MCVCAFEHRNNLTFNTIPEISFFFVPVMMVSIAEHIFVFFPWKHKDQDSHGMKSEHKTSTYKRFAGIFFLQTFNWKKSLQQNTAQLQIRSALCSSQIWQRAGAQHGWILSKIWIEYEVSFCDFSRYSTEATITIRIKFSKVECTTWLLFSFTTICTVFLTDDKIVLMTRFPFVKHYELAWTRAHSIH